MIGLEEQIKLFKLIGAKLGDKTECVAIGGSAMLFYGLKSATKDVDIVFTEKRKMSAVKSALIGIGFAERKNIIEKGYERIPVILDRKDSRFDLFLGKIVKFELSHGMLARIKEVHEFDNFIVKIIAPEDIILLKCATDREGDRIDAKDVIDKFELNWNIIVEEAIWQMQKTKKFVPIFLYDFLSELKHDFGSNIPKSVIARLRVLSEKELDRIGGTKSDSNML